MLPGWENAIETTNFMKKAVAGLVNEDLTVDDIFVREVASDPHRTSRSCARWELLADTGFCRCPTRLDCLALPCETIRDRRGAIQAALKHIWCQGCTFVARSRGRGRSPSIWDCRRKTCVRGLSIVSRCVVLDSVPSLIVSMLGTYSVLQIPTSSSEFPSRTHWARTNTPAHVDDRLVNASTLTLYHTSRVDAVERRCAKRIPKVRTQIPRWIHSDSSPPQRSISGTNPLSSAANNRRLSRVGATVD